MGLDMMLEAKRYVGSSEREKLVSITQKLGYWRKANQIHGWFVNTVQNGVDDQREYPVSREQLKELKALCEEALKNKDKAGEILPPTSGFFFGSYEVDEYYFKDCEDTIKIIDEALELPEEWDIIYSCWW